MINLSTGTAAAPGDTNPDYFPPQTGTATGTSSDLPADWLAANGGVIPNAPGCPPPAGGPEAFDGVKVNLEIKVPSNANSFSLSTKCYSSEYPEWVCSPYNDTFVVLLDSIYGGGQANPPDKNLAPPCSGVHLLSDLPRGPLFSSRGGWNS